MSDTSMQIYQSLGGCGFVDQKKKGGCGFLVFVVISEWLFVYVRVCESALLLFIYCALFFFWSKHH